MPEVRFEGLLAGLPPEPARIFDDLQAQVAASGRKVVVLDDDPTGTQTVHGVEVLTEWSVDSLQQALEGSAPAFYILTNSRSLPLEAAQALNRAIGVNLRAASLRSGKAFTVISRSDSTLRGHFPGEVDALAEGLHLSYDGLIVAPYFREGGRYTIGDTHYVVNGDVAVPAGETEFARDPAFGYTQSDLRQWVQEKTDGRVRAEQVESLSIGDIRTGRALPKVLALHHQQVCIVNAASEGDIEQVALALVQAEQQGRHFLYRTAASFVRARAAIPPRPVLTSEELGEQGQSGGLIVVGSYVPKTSAQLSALRLAYPFCEVELDVRALIDDTLRDDTIAAAVEAANRAMADGQDVLLFTSRELVKGQDGVDSLRIGTKVSESLVSVVRGITTRPRYLVAKGGITSSDVATKGLSVRKALVLGQLLPGVPVWQLGPESRYPGMVYVVFPGNVGTEQSLVEGVAKFHQHS